MKAIRFPVVLAAALLAAAPALAQDYPAKTITIVVPFPPGPTDTVARLVGQTMQNSLNPTGGWLQMDCVYYNA